MTLTCRFCSSPLQTSFADLGASPLANSYLERDQLAQPEVFYPLHARVCGSCFLVQLPELAAPEQIFSDYAYFSSFSDSWLEHARRYAEAMVERFGLGAEHRVLEIASNDGYLLRWFHDKGIPVLGIEPAANVAAAAEARGIPTRIRFFGEAAAIDLVEEGFTADLLVGNNVLAHVPALNDFCRGLATILAPEGILTLEVPHLQRLVEGNQFDTIYHEHFSYFSLGTAKEILGRHGLVVFDVEELPTHGGSLRLYARQAARDAPETTGAVSDVLAREAELGYRDLDLYRRFAEEVRRTKRSLLRFLLNAKEEGATVVGYGAPAKGNTLLNYCGIGTDFVEYTVDRSPHKQGRYLPGTRIPIHPPERIAETRPDYVWILPWNLTEEITHQMALIRSWGGRFVVAIPEVMVIP
jgi:SAM-dependent methyltransferase